MAEIVIPKTMILVGVAGEFGSGKDTASNMITDEYRLKGKYLDMYSTSRIIRDFANTLPGRAVVQALDIEDVKYNDKGGLTRTALLHTGYWLQDQFGEDCLTRWMIEEAIRRHDMGSGGLVINGIRRPAEADLIRKLGLDLCWLDIRYLTRYGNVCSRGESMDLPDFLKKTHDEEDDLMEIKAQANVHFDNNYSKAILGAQVEAYVSMRV